MSTIAAISMLFFCLGNPARAGMVGDTMKGLDGGEDLAGGDEPIAQSPGPSTSPFVVGDKRSRNSNYHDPREIVYQGSRHSGPSEAEPVSDGWTLRHAPVHSKERDGKPCGLVSVQPCGTSARCAPPSGLE